jgi:hypothetical protein
MQPMPQAPQGPQPNASPADPALGNRAMPPQRAIDKLLMGQQQQQPRSLAFPMGIPPNQQPPNMPQQSGPVASSFMNSVLGPSNGNIQR